MARAADEITVHVTVDTTEFDRAMARCREAMAAVPRIPLTLPVRKPWWHLSPFWHGYFAGLAVAAIAALVIRWLP